MPRRIVACGQVSAIVLEKALGERKQRAAPINFPENPDQWVPKSPNSDYTLNPLE